MKKELDELLRNRYLALFRDCRVREAAEWGFSGCGDGWFELIDCLSGLIQRHADDTGLDVTAIQVKEKFGALRFYTSGGDEYIAGLVSIAGRISESVCEECGARGYLSGNGWMNVRCEAHGGIPHPPPRVPTHASYVIGSKGVRVFDDNGLIVTGQPRPEPAFHLPEIRTERFRPLAAALEQVLDIDIRRNGMPMVLIDDVTETETLAFCWHGGDDEGRAEAYFRLVEVFSARV
ncbi:hypothetical protein AzCIB_1748 [Azoarcus sp. CIB]|uniref:hypothetical protein n=1 Tax=Aromatoleum sp. (strain CIB) TaxID=198107 RepID=UPI00067E2182|nr:hypothetical protein [Azoarcus sp. CIB]AKU11644.1 hypothetical protein AzCIB_1748 [Azoarcus sp. CIB]